MLLNEFFDYKNLIMKTLCSNMEIVRLVTDSSAAPVPNYDLAYKQIFPYEFIPDHADNGKTYICFDVDVSKVIDKTFYQPVLNIWVISHVSKLRLGEGGVRTDQIAAEIDKELNGSRRFGLGELNLYSVGRVFPNRDYRGRILTYTAIDFNRPGISKAPPINRKVRE